MKLSKIFTALIRILIISLCSCLPSLAAEMSVETFKSQNGDQKKVVMRGEIITDDLERFKQATRRDPKLGENDYDYNLPRVLDLSGHGTDYTTAIEISKLVHENAMRVFVPENQACQGPCAIIFMAGRTPSGDGYFDAARCLRKGSKLTFGVPSIAERLAAAANEGQLTRNTRLEVLRFVIEFVQLADQHDWPDGLLDEMLGLDQDLSVTPESTQFTDKEFVGIGTYKSGGEC